MVDIAKLEMDIKEYECMLEDAKKHLKSMICGAEPADAPEIKCVAEIVGELEDAMKDCTERCYKMQIMDAMEETPDRMGYNMHRGRNGRYIRGYRPYMEEMDYEMEFMKNPDFEKNMRMGYRDMDHGRYGRAYNEYRVAKRHYTENHDDASKNKMKETAMDHVRDVTGSLKEMYRDAEDMNMKNMIRNDVQMMLQEMN